MFDNLRQDALDKITELCSSELELLAINGADQRGARSAKASQAALMSIRYVGVLQQVKRAMMAVSYLLALCGHYYCVKTSGDALIFGEIVR